MLGTIATSPNRKIKDRVSLQSFNSNIEIRGRGLFEFETLYSVYRQNRVSFVGRYAHAGSQLHALVPICEVLSPHPLNISMLSCVVVVKRSSRGGKQYVKVCIKLYFKSGLQLRLYHTDVFMRSVGLYKHCVTRQWLSLPRTFAQRIPRRHCIKCACSVKM